MLGKCEECGVEFVKRGEKDYFCTPCTDRLRATEPPEALLDMRAVWGGAPPANQAQVMLKGLYEKSPAVFLQQLRAAEKEWREVIAKLQPQKESGVPSGTPEEDEGSDRIEEVIERLLREANSEGS